MIFRRHSSVLARCAGLLLAAAVLLPASLLRAQDPSSASGNTGASAGTGASNDMGPAQPDSAYVTPVEAGVQGLDRVSNLPNGSFSQYDPTGLPYSEVPILQRTDGNLNNINALSGSPFDTTLSNPAKIGDAEGSFSLRTANGGLSLPFSFYGTEPQNADIKAGPFYVKFHSLDGLVLYDDNYLGRETNRKSETLALLSLNLSIIAQITDDIQFTISGSIIYLPLQNQVGLGLTSNAFTSLGLFLSAFPAFVAQLGYNTMIAGWPVQFIDRFSANTGSFSDNVRDNFDLFRADYTVQNENGGYIFHSGRNGANASSSITNSNLDASVVYFSNGITAITQRDLPEDIRLTVRVDHDNFWYNQDNRGLPPGRDDLYASLVSERPNQRFRPYASYSADYIEGSPGVTQTVWLGIFGPIDDQISMNATAGYFFASSGGNSALYNLTLTHDAGPYTTEEFVADRSLSFFDQEIITSEYYRLNQTLGPTLLGTLFVARSDYQNIVKYGTESHYDDNGGVELGWLVGPKTHLQLAGLYTRQEYSGGDKSDTISLRAILNRTITDSLTFQLFYQYQHNTSTHSGSNYYENVVYLRFVQWFD